MGVRAERKAKWMHDAQCIEDEMMKFISTNYPKLDDRQREFLKKLVIDFRITFGRIPTIEEVRTILKMLMENRQ